VAGNAGRGLLGALEEVSGAEARSLFDVNVFGLINVTRAVLPITRAAASGKIVNIGSRAGFEGEPGMSMYAASKFAVAGVSEALAAELGPFGIQSMLVEPGVFCTDFLDASSIDDANHRQLGEPAKGAALIHKVTMGEVLPLHLPLGRDTLERQHVKTTQLEQNMQRWRAESVATAHIDSLES